MSEVEVKTGFKEIDEAAALQVMIVKTLAAMGIKLNRKTLVALAMIIVHNAPRSETTAEEVLKMTKAIYDAPGEGYEIRVGTVATSRPS